MQFKKIEIRQWFVCLFVYLFSSKGLSLFASPSSFRSRIEVHETFIKTQHERVLKAQSNKRILVILYL